MLSDREAGSRPAMPAAVRPVPLERLAADDPGRWDALAVVSGTRDPRALYCLLTLLDRKYFHDILSTRRVSGLAATEA